MEAIILLFFTGIIALFFGIFNLSKLTTFVSISGLIGALVIQHYPLNILSDSYNLLAFNQVGNGFVVLAILLTALIILAGDTVFSEEKEHIGDYNALLLFSLCGGIILIGFKDLFMFFLGLEILSIPLYVLAGSKNT